MTQFLQISDTHIVKPGSLVSGRLETSGPLKRLALRIAELQFEVGPLDGIVVTGDVSDDGTAESYALFKSILKPLDLPIFCIPGNHDARTPFRAAFDGAGYLPKAGKLNWQHRLGALQVIGLDTLIEGQGGGELDQDSLQFLKTCLADLKQAPAVVMMHHPPFKSGMAFMDSIGLQNGTEQLSEILAEYQGEILVLCGHIHRNISTRLAGHTVISAPSVCSSFLFNTHHDAPIGFLKQEGGVLLHQWAEGFKSIRIDPVRGDGPFGF